MLSLDNATNYILFGFFRFLSFFLSFFFEGGGAGGVQKSSLGAPDRSPYPYLAANLISFMGTMTEFHWQSVKRSQLETNMQ